jgi:serine/threonine protein kinase
MGYLARIELDEREGETWIGEHRPELCDLEPIFSRAIGIDLARLAEGGPAANDAWQAAMPDGVTSMRVLGPRCVHLHVADAVARDIVVKIVWPRPDDVRLRNLFERSRSHRAHLWAHRLRALGIETPRPLGYVERRRAPSRSISFAAFEYVGAPTLTEIRDGPWSLLPFTPEGLREKRSLIRRVAELMADLHRKGVFHADLHPSNILVSGESLLLVDLESIRTFALPWRAATRNLVRLNRDFRDTRMITRTDRMRFVQRYLFHDADAPTRRRALWSDVLERTSKKLRDRGESFVLRGTRAESRDEL